MNVRSKAPPWIPPEPLLFAQAMLLFSWIALFLAGVRGIFGVSPIGLAWVHAIVLGWLSSTALAFLIHVLPGFTGVSWRYERLARATLWLFQAGVVVLVAGFAAWIRSLIVAGGAIVVVSVFSFLVPFFATVGVAMRDRERGTRAVARALAIVIGIFGIAVALGFALAIGLNLGRAFVIAWAPAHGLLGIVGWLALLVAGVSVRTYQRLFGGTLGRRSHIVTSALALLGIAVWIAGRAASVHGIADAGSALVVVAAAIYLASVVRALGGTKGSRNLARDFVTASSLWLAVAIGYAIANLTGRPDTAALAFAILLGWIGQNVNAHLMHVGVRLLATLVIDNADETQPADLLDRRASIVSFVGYQAAIACGIAGLSLHAGRLLEAAAILGLCGMAAMATNTAIAAHRATRRRLENALA